MPVASREKKKQHPKGEELRKRIKSKQNFPVQPIAVAWFTWQLKHNRFVLLLCPAQMGPQFCRVRSNAVVVDLGAEWP